jgi:hypothetical protein
VSIFFHPFRKRKERGEKEITPANNSLFWKNIAGSAAGAAAEAGARMRFRTISAR